jgi:hypothetical protein
VIWVHLGCKRRWRRNTHGPLGVGMLVRLYPNILLIADIGTQPGSAITGCEQLQRGNLLTVLIGSCGASPTFSHRL